MLDLLVLLDLFTTFGPEMICLILTAIMLRCLSLVSAFSPRFQPLSASYQQPSTTLWRQALVVLAVLTFYISPSTVWTFIDTIGSTAGLTPTQVDLVLVTVTVCGIIGTNDAVPRGTRRADHLLVWLGYDLLVVDVGLSIDQSPLVRYTITALLSKFTWTLVLPSILARVAGLDSSGRLVNSINLVIGGGMATGPTLTGALLQHFASANPLLAAVGACALLPLILIAAVSAVGKAQPTGG